ncbi:hypothetical protein A5674_20750 [Mycobacterium malmoense]|uniref:hypothetical protein n=1 Tax=Mycobacterium malmoense TaxID=1780 RepID=UPI00080BA2B3|nr:hypothetical protein [Mycobacterium malmoense]OCB25683.1 hypothetical protein A5674_20750 [Mycobacterium malmoense]
MSDHNDGQLYDRSFWHRLNQQYAEAGGTAVLPEDWARLEAEDNAMCLELPYDGEPVARRIAGHLVKNYHEAWDVAGKRLVYEGWCPESEAVLYALSYTYSGYAVPLRNIEQLCEVKADYLGGGGVYRCNTVVNAKCRRKTLGANAEYPVEFLAIKRGENICVFTACHYCMLHISSRAGVDHPDYIGPAEDWFDDRQAQPYDTYRF